ncbi:hypothetical protein [Halorhabdus rudnickae]|uniref:hypothetical protein n=1 Tax=Halorhabdus rudnickae TaxID=1775544 RepID=UPI0010848F50|nr:hypothetical protein [Halorhabdus rudnickae]
MRSTRLSSLAIGIGALLVGVATVAGWIFVLSTPWAEGAGFAAGMRIMFAMFGIISGIVTVGSGTSLLAVERFLSPSSTERKFLAGGAGLLAGGLVAANIGLLVLWYTPYGSLWMQLGSVLVNIAEVVQPVGFILTVDGLILVAVSTRRDGYASPGRTLLRASTVMVLLGIASLVLSNVLGLSRTVTIVSPFSLGWLLLSIGVPTLLLGGLLAVNTRWRRSPAA